MRKTTAAKKYVAIDCHDSTLVVEVMSVEGAVEMNATVPTRGEAIRSVLEGLKAPLEIVFEEGALAQWLHDVLKPMGHRIVVCDPRKNRRRGNKSDRIDTHDLANRLRMNDLSAVYHERGSLGGLKELAGSYVALVEDSVRTMLRIKSIYRGQAIGCKGKKVYAVKQRGKWLEQLEEPARHRAQLLYEELDVIKKLRQQAKKALLREARRQPGNEILRSVPLIGPIRAALLQAILMTPWRFRTKRQLWGYAGLAVRTYSSADQVFVDGKLIRRPRAPMTRGLNPNHNRLVKEIFKAVAHDGTWREGVWKSIYQRLCAGGMRAEMAQLTLARKIAAVTLTIWKKGVRFDPKQLTAPTT